MKKFIIFICCVTCVSLVFGINARLSYGDLKSSTERVETSADVISDDLEVLRMISFLFENYSVERRVVLIAPFLETITISIVQNATEDEIVRESFTFSEIESAQHAVILMAPMLWDNSENESLLGNIGVWDNVIDAIGSMVFVLGSIFTILVFAVQFILDSVITAWELVRFFLYVIGL